MTRLSRYPNPSARDREISDVGSGLDAMIRALRTRSCSPRNVTPRVDRELRGSSFSALPVFSARGTTISLPARSRHVSCESLQVSDLAHLPVAEIAQEVSASVVRLLHVCPPPQQGAMDHRGTPECRKRTPEFRKYPPVERSAR